MPKRKAGTPKKLLINGIPFSLAFDVDIEEIFTLFENSVIPSVGQGMIKQELRVPSRNSIVLLTDGGEREILKAFSESGDTLNFSYTNRADDVYRAQGTINVESNTTSENRTTIQLLPLGDFSAFLA